MIGNLGGDLIALEYVLQRLDLEAEVLGLTQQHQDLVGTIAVAVHHDRGLKNALQSLESNVAAGGSRVLALGDGRVVGGPLFAVGKGPGEGAIVDRLDPHARRREAVVVAAPV